VRAFEAVARLGSITQAAHELNVTQSAISRHVKALEDYVGVPLTQRQGRGVVLTASGRSYQPDLESALDRIAFATREIAQRPMRRSIVIRSGMTFASRWLVPRLGGFALACPDIDVRLEIVSGPSSHEGQDFDVLLRCLDDVVLESSTWREKIAAGLVVPFATERKFPVCSPALVQRHAVSSPHDLVGQVLLRARSATPAWRDWLAQVGVRVPLEQPFFTFDNHDLCIEGAIHGIGFAIASEISAGAALESGALVRPFPQPGLASRTFCAIFNEAHRHEAPAREFCRWLLGISAAA
jgi:LysR family glycine cleavage system transcriptional activator